MPSAARVPTKRKTAKRVARRPPDVARQEILDAAFYFLHHHPFREMSIGDLMSHTRIGRSAFYAYFKDVYEVVEAVMAGIRDQVLGYAAAWHAEDLAPEAAMRLFLTDAVNLWAVHGVLISGVMDAATESPRLQAVVDSVLAIYQTTVVAILKRENAAGRARAMDFEEMAALLVIGTTAYLKARMGHGGRRDPLLVAATLQDLWSHTIYSENNAGAAAPAG